VTVLTVLIVVLIVVLALQLTRPRLIPTEPPRRDLRKTEPVHPIERKPRPAYHVKLWRDSSCDWQITIRYGDETVVKREDTLCKHLWWPLRIVTLNIAVHRVKRLTRRIARTPRIEERVEYVVSRRWRR
jgi:hypothetical protein